MTVKKSKNDTALLTTIIKQLIGEIMTSIHCCNEMKKHLASKEVAIRYVPKFREYGISYLDDGTSFQEINFCPWCGKKTVDSFREQ